ncbi:MULTISPECIES: hypothetical protein [Arthrobacter]|nr:MULTISPECIES: hypothetical protein [Arthrobacter]MBT8162654.1 hypothetical protein [Arthrobacter sp. GN70]
MEVTVIIEAPDGTLGEVSATGESYLQAREAALALAPEGHKAIAIRTGGQ